jgi:hypothetical protein
MSKYFQNNKSKYTNVTNQFKAHSTSINLENHDEQWRNRIIDWTTFYRRNIHRFIQHYFGVQLYWYQVIWLYFMSICDNFVTIASRASAKSWLIALLALARACLYPNSEIVVVASTQKQAAIIFGKIEGLKNDYPNIAREIKEYQNSQNKIKCTMQNGSTIKVVACNESGRGERSTFTIGEEFRIMDKKKFDSIVKPFAYARQTPYLKDPKYKHLIEEPRQVLISSAYHKSLWWYKETADTIKMMMQGKSCGFIAFDYLIAIRHGIKTANLIANEKTTMDEITFMEEYENIPFGENSDAYFKLDMFRKNRDIKKAFYPIRKDQLTNKKNVNDIKRVDGEIRVVACDIATRVGKTNDNTIITCIRALPTSKGYQREFVYMESHQGEHTGLQALRIKQIYYDFNADYIVLDLQNAGIAIYEQLGVVTKDEERGIEYEPLTVYEHKSLNENNINIGELKYKTLAMKAKPVIYPISATPKLNSAIAVDFRDKLQKDMCHFLIDDIDAEDYLGSKNREYQKSQDTNIKVWYIHPYRQLTEMVNECVNLKYSMSNTYVKLETVGMARKDRYTSCSYGNYFITLLEQDLLKEQEDYNYSDYFITANNVKNAFNTKFTNRFSNSNYRR